MDTGLAYATNPGNLQLEMSDLKLEAEVEADPLLETSATLVSTWHVTRASRILRTALRKCFLSR